ncbi:MAG: hypothetical protein JW774_11680 [Candidatus Aureabacteria bacterium]|nr:hypothetical protein [Candidatus Auribacterota bacterium]
MKSFLRFMLLFLFLSGLICLATWPWISFFTKGFPSHWDPPFHAWKLKLVAENLIQGHLLPPYYNSNCFFPSSMTLYYEALHWPQSVVAALILLFTDNPMLMYNLISLLFWTCSGCCFYLVLRELSFTRTASVWGASVFCILPYRISYLVEFNMQLCSMLILCFFFLVRFIRHPSIMNTLGLSLSFGMQAVSELYQALIFLMISPLLFLPLMNRNLLKYLKKPRFYYSLILAGVIGLGLYTLYLRPYQILHHDEGFSREFSEIQKHTLEPFSYLTSPRQNKSSFFGISVRKDEMSVFPTYIILIGALLHGFFHRRLFKKCDPAQFKCASGQTISRLARWGRAGFGLFLILWITGLSCSNHFTHQYGDYAATILNLLIMGFFLSSILIPLAEGHMRNSNETIISAIASAAVLAFIMSLGPEISFRNTEWACQNNIFSYLYHTPFLSGMRVVSRFGIIVLIFLLISAVSGWEKIAQYMNVKKAVLILWIPMLIWAWADSLTISRKMKIVEYPLQSKTLTVLNQHPRSPVIILPFGDRSNDSYYMLQIAGIKRPLLYGWGGFYPSYQQDLHSAFKSNDLQKLIDLVQMVYPDPLILIDRQPYSPHDFSAALMEKEMAGRCFCLEEDNRFSLYAMHSTQEASARYQRITRSDFLRSYPFLTFSALPVTPAHKPCRVWITVNGSYLKELVLNTSWQTYQSVIPEEYILDVYPNNIRIESCTKENFFIKNFSLFAGKPESRNHAKYDKTSVLKVSWNGPDSITHVPALADWVTLDPFYYKNGLILAGYEITNPHPDPKKPLQITSYWRCSPTIPMIRDQHLAIHLHEENGKSQMTDEQELLSNTVPQDIRSQPYEKIFCDVRRIPIPPSLESGIYSITFEIIDTHWGHPVLGQDASGHSRRFFMISQRIMLKK